MYWRTPIMVVILILALTHVIGFAVMLLFAVLFCVWELKETVQK